MHILSEQSYAFFFYPPRSIKYYMGNDLPCSYTVHCPRQHLNSRPFISARRGQSCFLCYSFSNILVPVTGVFNLLLTLLFRSNFCPILLVEHAPSDGQEWMTSRGTIHVPRPTCWTAWHAGALSWTTSTPCPSAHPPGPPCSRGYTPLDTGYRYKTQFRNL